MFHKSRKRPARQLFSRLKLFDRQSERYLRFEPLEERRLLTITAQLAAPVGEVGDISLVDFNGEAVFISGDANSLGHPPALFKTDGTPAGTVVIKDFTNYVNHLININGTLFFNAEDAGSAGLWKSDGTTNGTVFLKAFSGQAPFFNANPYHVTNVNGTLFFSAGDDVNGDELWKSDGTAAGTVLVKDLFPGTYYEGTTIPNSGSPDSLVNVNGTLFFRAITSDGPETEQLWKSDGTAAGTAVVKDINPGGDDAVQYGLTNVNGTVYFTATDGAHGFELWKTDGTAAGTVLVKDISPGAGSSYPTNLTNVNGTLYFTANDGVNGRELWKSDGTAAGTVLVRDIQAGSGSSSPDLLTNADGTLYFSADDGIHGRELWKSDGTTAGTVLVSDILPGSGSSSPNTNNLGERSLFTLAGSTVFFSADDGVHGRELWMSDGTATGTVDLGTQDFGSPSTDITNVNGQIYFAEGGNLWVLVMPPVQVPVNTATINSDLQTAVSGAVSAATGTGAGPSQVVLAVSQTQIDPVVAAVENLAPNTSGQVVTVVVNLADGDYSGQTIAVPAGVQLVIDGTSSSITFVGHSPAFTVTSGNVVLKGISFTNTTDASTILVTGGSVTVRNSQITETTGGARAAIEITGGTADLGTTIDPGGNTIVVSGPGDFVKNATSHEVPVYGDTFKIGATPVVTDITVVDPQNRLIFDATSGGLTEVSTVLLVAMDLQPQSLNIDQNGTISLVVYGSSQFAVTQVSLNSLTFAGVSINVFNQTISDKNGDGTADLTLQFKMTDQLKAALTAIYSNLLLEDYAGDHTYSTKQDALLALDGTFGALGQQFEGTDSTTVFLAGKSLTTLLSSLGI